MIDQDENSTAPEARAAGPQDAAGDPPTDGGRPRRPGGRKARLDDSALPELLRRIVTDVVRATRLWRSERDDVTGELIAHFTDGLEPGESAQSLAAAFGEPQQAARLIRRAKRRQRPLAWKIWGRSVQVVLIVLVVVVGLYVAATIRLITGTPDIRSDYLADINALAQAVPEDERAWVDYRRAVQQLGVLPLAFHKHGTDLRPGDPQWYDIVSLLDEHAETLELVREASRRPGLGFVVGFGIDSADAPLWPHLEPATDDTVMDGNLWSILMPHLRELRNLAQLLILDARRAADAGDGTLLMADIAAALAIAEQARETPLIGCDLVALSVIRTAIAAAGEILGEQPEVLTDGQLRELAHRLAALQGGRLDVRLAGEILAFRDLMQRLYTDDGAGGGRLTAQGLGAFGGGTMGPLAPAAAMVVAGRQEMTNEFNRWFAVAEAESAKPLWRQDAALVDREIHRLKQSWVYSTRYHPIVTFMPALTRIGRLPELVTQERDALSAAIALELYRRRTGSWPPSLAELVPDLLPRVPPDRFKGDALRYRLVAGKPLLYSVGADGVDDGGEPPVAPGGRPVPNRATLVDLDGEPVAEGDWILWPPARPEARRIDSERRARQDGAYTGS